MRELLAMSAEKMTGPIALSVFLSLTVSPKTPTYISKCILQTKLQTVNLRWLITLSFSSFSL